MINEGYEQEKKDGATYFAALNSGRGFISYYDKIFGDGNIKRRYIIKGGPGTGKSSFMRRIAALAEAYGRSVVYYRCSSDPASLDGIIIDGAYAFFDGTAPHVYEPNIAGAADEIINLGMFWDSDKLYMSYNEIAALSSLKSEAYKRAYKFLSAAMNVADINRELMLPALMREKLLNAVRRLMRDIPNGEGCCVEYGFSDAIGMGGRVHLDTYERHAKRLYEVYDSYGLCPELLGAVADVCMEKGLRIRVSYMPLMPSLLSAVYICEHDIAFVAAEGREHSDALKLNMRRFENRELINAVKGEYRYNRGLEEALVISAEEALADAGRHHFELEKIYTACMDFNAEERFADDFCRKFFMRRK